MYSNLAVCFFLFCLACNGWCGVGRPRPAVPAALRDMPRGGPAGRKRPGTIAAKPGAVAQARRDQDRYAWARGDPNGRICRPPESWRDRCAGDLHLHTNVLTANLPGGRYSRIPDGPSVAHWFAANPCRGVQRGRLDEPLHRGGNRGPPCDRDGRRPAGADSPLCEPIRAPWGAKVHA